MKKKEYLALLAILLFAAGLYLYNRLDSQSISVSVYKGNELLKTIDMDKDGCYAFEGDNGKFNLEIKDRKARAYDVECPNQICVHTGWISIDNPVPIVCLPNNIVVKIDER